MPQDFSHALLATATRGSESDTVHFGSACLVDDDGKVLWSIGDAEARAFFRSSSKPLQALPVIDAVQGASAADAFGFDGADLAIICGSHAGGAAQVRQVRGILRKIGLRGNRLRCGQGLADNCSGKHAGMLAACAHQGYDLETYCDVDHPLQKRILAGVARYCGLDAAAIGLAEDGCSAPTFYLPLRNMALGFARLGREAASAPAAGGPARLFRAMLEHPGGHTGEPDLRGFAVNGDIPVTKGGANGLLCAALPAQGLGFALKVADGSALVRWPVFIAALERAGLVAADAALRMRETLSPKITTRRGKAIGAIVLAF